MMNPRVLAHYGGDLNLANRNPRGRGGSRNVPARRSPQGPPPQGRAPGSARRTGSYQHHSIHSRRAPDTRRSAEVRRMVILLIGTSDVIHLRTGPERNPGRCK
ncbi:hypothetical protein DLJ57_02535 [Micromonospora chalcea]|nr:hypothetical protein DLJ57_02535 [Micromonospora chalcea]